MVFIEPEIDQIARIVGGFCERRVPEHVLDTVRLGYTIANQEVVIVEGRLWREKSSEWTEMEIAKLRYVRKRDEWQLYWKRASGKWWPYQPHGDSRTLAAMIKNIDLDSHGCFFG